MSFLKETNYHGSRTYEAEPATDGLISHYRLRAALAFAWARLRLEKFLRSAVAPSRVETGFTLLGAKRPVPPPKRRIEEIFPIAGSAERSRRSANDRS